jgi:transposase-like protein
MDIQKEAVREYLVDGIPYRALSKKYGVTPPWRRYAAKIK